MIEIHAFGGFWVGKSGGVCAVHAADKSTTDVNVSRRPADAAR